ncbi:MAG: hypothetical protein ACJ744_01050 [Gaiellaceae bacterium]|jgi:hypothetical protein
MYRYNNDPPKMRREKYVSRQLSAGDQEKLDRWHKEIWERARRRLREGNAG